jgi:hypothetical protein
MLHSNLDNEKEEQHQKKKVERRPRSLEKLIKGMPISKPRSNEVFFSIYITVAASVSSTNYTPSYRREILCIFNTVAFFTLLAIVDLKCLLKACAYRQMTIIYTQQEGVQVRLSSLI